MLTGLVLASFPVAIFSNSRAASNVPKVWTDEAMRSFELPRAHPVTIQQYPSALYYQIPERKIWKTYPIYPPGKEPKGYWAWLKQQPAQEAVDWSAVHTKADWIRAGSLVFEGAAQDLSDPYEGFVPVRAAGWFEKVRPRLAKDGTLPFYRYVITESGKVSVTSDSCASCHSRVLDNGEVIRGAQGNVPFGRVAAFGVETLFRGRKIPLGVPDKPNSDDFYDAPWIKPDPTLPLGSKTQADFNAHSVTIPEGVNLRQGTSAMYPIQIPDIIGVKDHAYLDRTGVQPNHGIVDLMRYAATQNFIDEIASYDGFIPANKPGDTRFGDPKTMTRSSDRELYALALYLYSLQPPVNPNRWSPLAARGQAVFRQEGCPQCHTPPLYTNNKLLPVEGFTPSQDERKRFNISSDSIDTDPFNALNTRRGTGFYKVPSLKGVWYRGPFEHNGSVATLEDWFDPHRLDDNYVPTGYVGYHTTTRAVRGHQFGLDLSPEDRRALIAFLKTL